MINSKGFVLLTVIAIIFISGCKNNDPNNHSVTALREARTYELETERTAWLRNHLPAETVAYVNMPTPWNYLFDAKADAMHAIQKLPEHQVQIDKIKQGFKNSYFQYLPTQYHGLGTLLMNHVSTSLEVAVINQSPTALLPTVAVGTRLQNISAIELLAQLESLVAAVNPSIDLTQVEQKTMWTFQVGQFPAFLQYDEGNGQLLVYGGMGANEEKLSAIWSGSVGDQSSMMQQLSSQADPSGLNMKMWLAPARMYQLGGAFVQPEQKKMITDMGLNQLQYVWVGFESAQGQSAFAIHLMMPETGWRKLLPTPQNWFDVQLAGQPRSVIQVTLPTSDQVKHIINTFKLDEKMTDQDRKTMAIWENMSEELGFDFYDVLDAYQQQVMIVKDDSGSWLAMKSNNNELRKRIEKSFDTYFAIKSESKKLAGVDIMQAHFSIYQKLFEKQADLPPEAEKITQFLNIFKEHMYWYEEDEVIYMSRVPQVLAMRKNHRSPISLSSWLQNNQGGSWDSAMFAYGKDIKDLPQDMYHYYLQIIQALGDLAQTEVDLFALPTANQLELPDRGRLNLMLSADAEKVSLKFGYEYSLLEPIVSAEGGLATLAVIGILAATAIPAYKDYTVRAKIGNQLAMASAVKTLVAERITVDGIINEDTFKGIEDEISISGMNYYIDSETGTIVIDLEGVDNAFEAGDDIYLEPSVEEGYIEWFCLSSIKEAYLPTHCRF